MGEGTKRAVLNGPDGAELAELASLYRELHANPELSSAEHRTAAEIARRVEKLGYEVTAGVGGTGVVGVLRNGAGPTVLLRADFDGLPVREETGLPYASTATGVDPDGREVPVMHACGHDMHVTCLVGALGLLARSLDAWSGTVLAVFQPAEETGTGARAMVDDGLFERFGRPDVVLGQHVAPYPAGMVGLHAGPAFAATDGLRIRMFGKGAHGSRPEAAIDPVVMAAATVLRLQTLVSREIAATETAVVTVGSLHAGTKDNIIPAEAELRVNIRSYTPEVRTALLAGVERIVRAEAAASGATLEPEFTPLDSFPVLVNDQAAVDRARAALVAQLGERCVADPGPVTGSEDVGAFGAAAGVPTCYWLFGGTDPAEYARAEAAGRVAQDIPSNHSPHFAPVIEPTLSTGVTALVTVALAWLAA
ncbi:MULTISPECIES: amidohydrolase [unclassified Kitasatospora]|uniref:amidohydrolase n=1 Tax=unclassified Kitasatospora TaxID=2633591 RepID=UPI0007104B74|nr:MULTISPECIES: amidohydrolase [unclassified Kitasatospora]KQV21843.1 amidohydrolase [Kitasatospora sp. Root107]KRB75365.1 amidohydrolase [Kitasatospora sp. Root187]